jgi:hypothetical protein
MTHFLSFAYGSSKTRLQAAAMTLWVSTVSIGFSKPHHADIKNHQTSHHILIVVAPSNPASAWQSHGLHFANLR